MMMNRNGIAVAGSILVDTINTISSYPAEGELAQITAVSRSTGGCVPNVAIDLKRIDPQLPVFALGCIGADEDGRLVREELEAYAVDTSQVRVISEKTSFTQVMSVSGAQRTFFTHAGASARFGLDDVDFSALPVRRLHLGYFLLLDRMDGGDGLKLLKKAKAEGIHTSIDLISEESERYRDVLPCLPFTDELIVNELEAGRLTGRKPEIESLTEIAECLLELGVNERVIIHFPEGAVCAAKDGRLTAMGSFILPDGYLQGTTGAGDAFCAGALYALYQGLDDERVLLYGNACAAMSLGSPDAVSAVMDMETNLHKCQNWKRRTGYQ